MRRRASGRSSGKRVGKRRWRLLHWVLALIVLPPLLTVLSVLLLRFVDPPTSAFMLAERRNAGSQAVALDHRWRPADL